MSAASAGPTPATSSAGAPGRARRLTGVDAARGVALLAMMAVHVLPGRDPDGGVSPAYLLANGRAAAAFAVLAGVGLALLTGGDRWAAYQAGDAGGRRAAYVGIAVRALAIGLLGLLLGYPQSGVAVILATYGLLFLLAIPLLRLAPRTLAGLAVALALVGPLLSHLLRRAVPESSGANPTVPALLAEPGRVLAEVALTGYYPVLAWSAYLCAGLAAGRLALGTTRVALGLLVGGAGLGVGAALLSQLLLGGLGGREAIEAATPELAADDLDALLTDSQYGTTPTTTWWWLAADTPHSGTPLDLLHTTGTALALLGAMLLLARVGGRVLAPLAAAGSMTLTIYGVHVLLLASGLLPADPLTSYVLQAVVAVVAALLWRRAFRRGPLEAVIAMLAAGAERAVRASGGPRAGTRP